MTAFQAWASHSGQMGNVVFHPPAPILGLAVKGCSRPRLCENAPHDMLVTRFSGVDRGQSTLFPECLDDWIDEDNPVRVIDVFVDALDLGALDFGGVDPKATGRPSYHPSSARRDAMWRSCG